MKIDHRPSHSTPLSAAPTERGPELMRRVLLGATTALLAARMLAPGEDPGLLHDSSGAVNLILVLLWLLAAVGLAAWRGLVAPRRLARRIGRNGPARRRRPRLRQRGDGRLSAAGPAHRLGLGRPVRRRLPDPATGRFRRRPTSDVRRLPGRGRGAVVPGRLSNHRPRRPRLGDVHPARYLRRLAGAVPAGIDRGGDRLPSRPRTALADRLHGRLRAIGGGGVRGGGLLRLPSGGRDRSAAPGNLAINAGPDPGAAVAGRRRRELLPRFPALRGAERRRPGRGPAQLSPGDHRDRRRRHAALGAGRPRGVLRRDGPMVVPQGAGRRGHCRRTRTGRAHRLGVLPRRHVRPRPRLRPAHDHRRLLAGAGAWAKGASPATAASSG